MLGTLRLTNVPAVSETVFVLAAGAVFLVAGELALSQPIAPPITAVAIAAIKNRFIVTSKVEKAKTKTVLILAKLAAKSTCDSAGPDYIWDKSNGQSLSLGPVARVKPSDKMNSRLSMA